MSTVKIIGGDIYKGDWDLSSLLGETKMSYKGIAFDFKKDFERVELQTEESVKKLAGTAGWGLAGFALLGPLGAIGGMLIGGRGKAVCFAAYLKDGRKFLATTDGKTWQKIAAATF